MAGEMITYYLIKRGGKDVAVKVIHTPANKWAAKKAMMALFGVGDRDIQLESGGNPIWARTNPCMEFDGRNAH